MKIGGKMIFNQGKYKNLFAAMPDELTNIRAQVKQDKDSYPRYHLAPLTGLLNDPNGLVFDGEKYHIFYQWFPFDAIHGMKHWQHFTTTDFHTFYQVEPLIPTHLFESHGCYSGGAILINEHILAYYTGNVRNCANNQRIPHQNLAIFTKRGQLITKRCLLNDSPKGYTEHVRDPKPYLTSTGKIRFILGAQRQDLTGTALIYEMEEINATPYLLGEFYLPQFDNHGVFMWECPDLVKLGEQSLFIWSPQGKLREKYRFQNNYHATYALGTLTDNHFEATQIEELDYGFDFYAPQTFSNLATANEALLMAWVGQPDLNYPTDKHKWHSMLSLPRHLTLHNGQLRQTPATQIYAQLQNRSQHQLHHRHIIAHLDCCYLQFSVENRPLTITFFDNEDGQHLTLNYQEGMISLDRSTTDQTDTMTKFGSIRYCQVNALEQLEIFFDRSIIEIFINYGEKTMTSRFFIQHRQNVISVSRPILLSMATLPPISYQR